MEIDPNVKAPLNAKIVGRYTKQKSTSGGSGSGKRKTPSSSWKEAPAKKVKVKAHQMEKTQCLDHGKMMGTENSEDGFDLAKSQVIPKKIETQEDSSTSEDDSEVEIAHSELLEEQWKKRMNKLRHRRDEAIALKRKNKKHFD